LVHTKDTTTYEENECHGIKSLYNGTVLNYNNVMLILIFE